MRTFSNIHRLSRHKPLLLTLITMLVAQGCGQSKLDANTNLPTDSPADDSEGAKALPELRSSLPSASHPVSVLQYAEHNFQEQFNVYCWKLALGNTKNIVAKLDWIHDGQRMTVDKFTFALPELADDTAELEIMYLVKSASSDAKVDPIHSLSAICPKATSAITVRSGIHFPGEGAVGDLLYRSEALSGEAAPPSNKFNESNEFNSPASEDDVKREVFEVRIERLKS